MDNYTQDVVVDLVKLSEICDYVDTKKDGALMRETILCIKDTMLDNNLTALSAPQIGRNLRIFCVKDKSGLHSFVNPMIKKSVELTFSREKDASIPDKEFIHPRSSKIIVNYQTPLGDMKSTTVVGYSAFIFQQMIDHLNGVLVSDIGLEIDDQWDAATEDERAEVLKEYINSLDLMSKKLEKDISENESLAMQKKAIEFENALVSGELVLEQRELTSDEATSVRERIDEVKSTLGSKDCE